MIARWCEFEQGRCRKCGAARPDVPAEDTVLQGCLASCRHFGELRPAIKVRCGTREREAVAAECSLHGRCLPHWMPVDMAAWRDRDEAAIYHLCRGCDDFTT